MMPCFGLEFDMSVDEEIRKNYNPSKLELETLPPVPNVKPTTQKPPITSIPNTQPIPVQSTSTKTTTKPTTTTTRPTALPTAFDKSTAIRIKKGTTFTVKSNQAISDSNRVGTRVSFVSKQAVTQTYVTIQQGTVFRGEVVASHTPQYSGNGGLIVLKVDSMTFRGSTVGVNAKITKANHKKIFLNNIKGERRYLKSIGKTLKPGQRFYKKMARTTAKLANGNVTVILSPFTVVAGVVVYAVNIVGSPLLALYSKGGRITVPAGSEFEIKMLDDVYLF